MPESASNLNITKGWRSMVEVYKARRHGNYPHYTREPKIEPHIERRNLHPEDAETVLHPLECSCTSTDDTSRWCQRSRRELPARTTKGVYIAKAPKVDSGWGDEFVLSIPKSEVASVSQAEPAADESAYQLPTLEQLQAMGF